MIQDPAEAPAFFAEQVIAAGAHAVFVDARKGLVKSLSQKDNRHIPPLGYGLVHALKQLSTCADRV
ncbi:MAG: hypothetical protein WDN46_10960 [Methylocella sp.]